MKITKESAISAGLLLASLINQTLTMFGHSPLPLENDAVKNIVSTVFLIGTSIYAWFSDNPVSESDCVCSSLKKALKKGKIGEERVRELLAELKDEDEGGEPSKDEKADE